MSDPSVLPSAAQKYLTQIRASLADLADTDQAELTAEVNEHLAEVYRDSDRHTDNYADLVHRLGDPQGYAADLRAAAGLTPAPAARERDLTRHQDQKSVRGWLGAKAANRVAREVLRYLLELRPAWWALRGYLLVAFVLAVLTQGSGYQLHTLGYYSQALTSPGNSGRSQAWLLATAAAVVASIALGRVTFRLPPVARIVVAVLDGAAVFAFFAYPTWWLAPAFRSFVGL